MKNFCDFSIGSLNRTKFLRWVSKTQSEASISLWNVKWQKVRRFERLEMYVGQFLSHFQKFLIGMKWMEERTSTRGVTSGDWDVIVFPTGSAAGLHVPS